MLWVTVEPITWSSVCWHRVDLWPQPAPAKSFDISHGNSLSVCVCVCVCVCMCDCGCVQMNIRYVCVCDREIFGCSFASFNSSQRQYLSDSPDHGNQWRCKHKEMEDVTKRGKIICGSNSDVFGNCFFTLNIKLTLKASSFILASRLEKGEKTCLFFYQKEMKSDY